MKEWVDYWSMRGFRKWKFLSKASKFASDWTNVIGIMKKNAMKNIRNPTNRRRELSAMYGMDKLSQQTSRASGAQSVNQQVESLLCCVWAHTAAPHRELNDTKPAFMTNFSLDKMWHCTVFICQSVLYNKKHFIPSCALYTYLYSNIWCSSVRFENRHIYVGST